MVAIIGEADFLTKPFFYFKIFCHTIFKKRSSVEREYKSEKRGLTMVDTFMAVNRLGAGGCN